MIGLCRCDNGYARNYTLGRTMSWGPLAGPPPGQAPRTPRTSASTARRSLHHPPPALTRAHAHLQHTHNLHTPPQSTAHPSGPTTAIAPQYFHRFDIPCLALCRLLLSDLLAAPRHSSLLPPATRPPVIPFPYHQVSLLLPLVPGIPIHTTISDSTTYPFPHVRSLPTLVPICITTLSLPDNNSSKRSKLMS